MQAEFRKKIPVGIIGATGMVGQKFISLLEDHPWFQVELVAASSRSAGKSYAEAVSGRWMQGGRPGDRVGSLMTLSAEYDLDRIAGEVPLIFSAIDSDKAYIRKLEDTYAEKGCAVVSNNSAHRWTGDIPMLIPEVNPHHLDMISIQRKSRNWSTGLIVVKPNCSIQSYVPLLQAWKEYQPTELMVSTYQAISGAGKDFSSWPEMVDNVIPYIGGEEEKSEREPLKILAEIRDGTFDLAEQPVISAQCIRVAATDGHLASLHIRFREKTQKEDLIDALRSFPNPLVELELPSAPDPFITYFDEDDRPQTRLDRDLHGGMGISAGRLREDRLFLDWKCVALSHNTIRGAAGGGILNAELLVRKGFVNT